MINKIEFAVVFFFSDVVWITQNNWFVKELHWIIQCLINYFDDWFHLLYRWNMKVYLQVIYAYIFTPVLKSTKIKISIRLYFKKSLFLRTRIGRWFLKKCGSLSVRKKSLNEDTLIGYIVVIEPIIWLYELVMWSIQSMFIDGLYQSINSIILSMYWISITPSDSNNYKKSLKKLSFIRKLWTKITLDKSCRFQETVGSPRSFLRNFWYWLLSLNFFKTKYRSLKKV